MFEAVFVEGDLEVAIVEGLFRVSGIPFVQDRVINKRGIERFWQDTPRIDRAARHKLMFGLADLERHACAPLLIKEKLGKLPHPNFLLRLSVRMSESWLLSDRKRIAAFLGVSQKLIPPEPDTLWNPKQEIINIARHSSKRTIREGMVPERGAARRIGFDYLPLLSEFATNQWNPITAAETSPSLARALYRLNGVRSRQAY